MGVGADNLDKKAAQIAAIPGYKKLFETRRAHRSRPTRLRRRSPSTSAR